MRAVAKVAGSRLVPAKAGTQICPADWVPAFAGMSGNLDGQAEGQATP